MRARALSAAFAFVLASSVAAQTTDEALTSPRVRRALLVSRAAGGLKVCADGPYSALSTQGSCRTAGDKPLRFVADSEHEIDVAWADFNPLTDNVTGAITTVPDPAAVVLGELADALAKLGTGLTGARAFERSFQVEAQTDEDFRKLVETYWEIVKDPVLSGAELEGWRGQAVGRSGIENARSSMRDASKKLLDNFEAAERTLKQIETDANTETEKAIALTLRIDTASDPLQQKRRLQKAIVALHDSLEDYTTRGWIGTALVVNSVRVSPDEESIDTLSVRAVSWKYKDGALVQTVGEPTKVELRVRAHRRFVAEKALGVVHTRLRKATYKGVGEGDARVVQKGDDEPVDLSAAAVVNLVCRCSGTPGFNPMLQIGVASGGDVPAILVGGGLRLKGKAPVSLSGGVVFAWLKDLNGLKVGDPIASDLEIEADLTRRFTAKAYFGLQYKF